MIMTQNIIVKGVVRSKVSRGYVQVDGLGETLLFTRSKSNKNWPITGASNTTDSKIILSDLGWFELNYTPLKILIYILAGIIQKKSDTCTYATLHPGNMDAGTSTRNTGTSHHSEEFETILLHCFRCIRHCCHHNVLCFHHLALQKVK